MNMMTRVPVQPKPAEDPLDALFDTMFKPMNANGVYARTGPMRVSSRRWPP